MNYLAFDIGASSAKLTLAQFNNGLFEAKEIYSFDGYSLFKDGCLLWDIDKIYEEMKEGIKKAVCETNDWIDSFGVCSFCNDYVPVSDDGQVVGKVYAYRDERTLRNAQKCYEVMSKEELYKINGNQNALFNALNQLHAAGIEEPINAKKILFLSDYLVYKMTGVMQTEYTTASVSQMFDYGKNDWSDEILNKYNINKNLFAPLRFPGTLSGKTSKEFNSQIGSKGFDVYTVCQHDTASAFLAAKKDCAIISTGTWCIAGCETCEPIITDFGFKENIANEGGYKDGHHRILKNVMGTWILQELVKEADGITFAQLEKMAMDANCPDHFIDVDSEEFFAPLNMYSKINENSKQLYGKSFSDLGQMAKAVYESLAFKFCINIEKIEKLTGKRFEEIYLIGGAARSEILCQMSANICGRKVGTGPLNATALGNIIVQMLGKEEIKNVEEGRNLIQKSIDSKTYYPDENPIWKKQFEEFCKKINYKN